VVSGTAPGPARDLQLLTSTWILLVCSLDGRQTFLPARMNGMRRISRVLLAYDNVTTRGDTRQQL